MRCRCPHDEPPLQTLMMARMAPRSASGGDGSAPRVRNSADISSLRLSVFPK